MTNDIENEIEGDENNILGYGKKLPSVSLRVAPDSRYNLDFWILWYKILYQGFRDGLFTSKIKYSHAEAQSQANKVFKEHFLKQSNWSNNRNFGRYAQKFITFCNQVGLNELRSPIEKITTALTGGTTKVVEAASRGVVSVAEGAADVAGGIAGIAKYLPLIAVGLGLYIFFTKIK